MSWKTEFWIDEGKSVGLFFAIIISLAAVVPLKLAELAVRKAWR